MTSIASSRVLSPKHARSRNCNCEMATWGNALQSLRSMRPGPSATVWPHASKAGCMGLDRVDGFALSAARTACAIVRAVGDAGTIPAADPLRRDELRVAEEDRQVAEAPTRQGARTACTGWLGRGDHSLVLFGEAHRCEISRDRPE